MENIKKIESKSYESLSLVMVQLNPEADVDFSLNEAQRNVNAILADLPEDVDPPSLVKFSLDDMPIITVAATADIDNVAFYDLLDKTIEPVISRVPGVAQVNLIGGQEREIQVNFDQRKLEGYGLSILQARQIIEASNLDFPTGSVKTRDNATLIRLVGKYATVDELRNLVISEKEGVQIRLKDVADVQDTQHERHTIDRFEKEHEILIHVMTHTDTKDIAESYDILHTLDQSEKQYENINILVMVAHDSSAFSLVPANRVLKVLYSPL